MPFFISCDSIEGPFYSENEAVEAARKKQKLLKGSKWGKGRKFKVLIECGEVTADGRVSR